MSFFEDSVEPDNSHLRVFEDHSEYHKKKGGIEVFTEGILTEDARRRVAGIKEAFESGFLEGIISGMEKGELEVHYDNISHEARESIDGLVGSVTSEVGRALIGLSVMQLCIKAISPEQNIRLHKGGTGRNSFSWAEGVSMRTLDKNFVTPTLRRHDLLRLNADGFMMTRSLAENYPYTRLYKAQLRGARVEWLSLVEELQNGTTSPLESLKYMIAKLINAATYFTERATELMDTVRQMVAEVQDRHAVRSLMAKHSDSSSYAARLLEVSMHALMFSAVSTGVFGPVDIAPLSQMRSANKKHKNIGDIELLEDGEIIESWDAKYGKGYLREEIEEATEKLSSHNEIQRVGFVTTVPIERTKEIANRISEIRPIYGVDFELMHFDDWVDMIFDKCVEGDFTTESDLAKNWIITYSKYLGQQMRNIAPIDEPCLDWVESLTKDLKGQKPNEE